MKKSKFFIKKTIFQLFNTAWHVNFYGLNIFTGSSNTRDIFRFNDFDSDPGNEKYAASSQLFDGVGSLSLDLFLFCVRNLGTVHLPELHHDRSSEVSGYQVEQLWSA